MSSYKIAPTVSELVNEILMVKKSCLIVEGSSDSKFWDRVLEAKDKVKDKDYNIYIASPDEFKSNKRFVIEVVSSLETKKFTEFYGIVDKDYDSILKIENSFDRLLYYRYHDLEITLMKSTGFASVNDLISSEQKKMESDILLKKLYDKSYSCGLLRLINEKYELNLKFKGLDYKKFFKNGDYNLNNENIVIDYLCSFNGCNKEKREFIFECYRKEKIFNYQNEDICNGHDVLNILSLFTKKIISTNIVSTTVLLNYLILAYRLKDNTISELLDVHDNIKAESLYMFVS